MKRLQDFHIDDIKRYYQAIDENLDTRNSLCGKNETPCCVAPQRHPPLDFHEVYLALHYDSDGQSGVFKCNGGQPMVLDQIVIFCPFICLCSLVPAHTDSQSMDTYQHIDAVQVRNQLIEDSLMIHRVINNEQIRCRKSRWNLSLWNDGKRHFFLEPTCRYQNKLLWIKIQLRHTSLDQLQSYKIVLCLVSNTIPPQMDYHAIRWFCKVYRSAPCVQALDREWMFGLVENKDHQSKGNSEASGREREVLYFESSVGNYCSSSFWSRSSIHVIVLECVFL